MGAIQTTVIRQVYARFLAIVIFLVCLVVWFWLRWLRNDDSRLVAVGLSVCGVVGRWFVRLLMYRWMIGCLLGFACGGLVWVQFIDECNLFAFLHFFQPICALLLVSDHLVAWGVFLCMQYSVLKVARITWLPWVCFTVESLVNSGTTVITVHRQLINLSLVYHLIWILDCYLPLSCAICL